MKRHTVVVSNIGTVVLDGTRAEAKAAFAEYQSQSRSNLGRAAGEDVTWFSDGEIYKEYVGNLAQNENMRLSELLRIIGRAYPDQITDQVWAVDPLMDAAEADIILTGEDVGDTLAEFIVKEVQDTFCEGASGNDKILEAINALEKAREDLWVVAMALGDNLCVEPYIGYPCGSLSGPC